MDELYEALRVAEAEGRKDDVARLISYIDEQSAKQEPQQQDVREQIPRALGAGAGAITGAIAPGVIQSGLDKMALDKATVPPKISLPHPSELTPGVSNVDEALNKGVSNAFTQHTREAQVSQRQKSVDEVLKQLKAKGVPVNPKLLAEMPTQYAMPGSGVLVSADTAKQMEMEQAARAAAAKELPKNATFAQKLTNKVAPNLTENVGSFLKGVSEYKLPFGIKAGPLAGHLLGGAAAGSQFVDAYNRGQQGDTTGQILSNIGGAGTAASVLPFPPPVRAVGAGVGLSAEAINAYRDAMRRGQIVHGAPEDYSRTDAMGNAYATGGLVYLAEGGQPPKPQANEGGAFIGYPQINKNRKIGSGTGFLDALVGAPPSRTNILNPSDYSYMEGYEKGEPYGIASMALPFAGAAAKPLAKEVATRAFMGESLTPKMMRGLMPEAPAADIIAYHGTPHQFDKFKLSEIGQGEGSQAFGHGIYLAESPGVARGYQQALSGQMVTPQDLVDYFKPGEVRRKMGGYDKVLSFQPSTPDKSWHTVVQEVVKNKEGEWIPHPSYGRPRAHSTTPDSIDFKQNMGRELGPAGYFYKVDVPDEHIAKMVDWDLPFKEQPQHIQDAFTKVNPIAAKLENPNNEFTRWLRGPNAAKVLQEMDIPGIKYLDRGSRFGNQSAKTQNFVVFDPDKSTKILERNSEPIGPLSSLDKE